MARYEDTTVGSTHARLGTLTHTVMGPHGLVTKVTHLEELLLSGNLSTSQVSHHNLAVINREAFPTELKHITFENSCFNTIFRPYKTTL